MNFAQIYAELEAERSWREEEIRQFQNRAAQISSEDDRKRFLRAVVLLLYAHYEGFCKFAFDLYATSVNQANITCGKANYAIAAMSLADIFKTLRNPEKKSNIFRRILPDDSELHRFAREQEFVERTSELEKIPVQIPDDALDMESNLTPIVLKKNLYRLGLPHQKFDSLKDDINKLLGYRNAIAHGQSKDGIEEPTYRKLRAATYSIMSRMSLDLMQSLRNADYRRP